MQVARGPSAAPATVAVMVFPTLFLVLALSFLEWRFTRLVFGTVTTNPDFLAFRGGALGALRDAARAVDGMITSIIEPGAFGGDA